MAYTTIDDPGLYFNTVLYTGDIVDGDGSGHTLAITGVGFGPNLVWHKCRSAGQPHLIVDTVRGTSSYNFLKSSETGAEVTANVNGAIKTIDSDGITVEAGTDSSSKSNVAGADGFTYAFWNWKESATAGFDIVAYTGNGTDDTDISHSLSAVPHLILVKNRDTDSTSWIVYHHRLSASPEENGLYLDANNAIIDTTTYWSDEAPTSSVFTLGTNNDVNDNTKNMIAYAWSEKQGFSKFGSYTGNGNADGAFIYTGFRPAWLSLKRTDSTSQWKINDNKRLGYNPATSDLYADSNEAENTVTQVDFLSNGFKQRSTDAAGNGSGVSFIYIAFAEAPFVNSNGVPCNAR